MANYYEILGVSLTATSAEIRAAYFRIARDRHPDRFQDPTEKERAAAALTEATAAFNTLSNDRARALYDDEIQRPKPSTPQETAQLAFEQGLARYTEQDYHEAIELFRLAVAHDGTQARYHLSLARCLALNPHWIRRAVESYETALRLKPDDPTALSELASLLESQGLHLRAQRLLEGAKRTIPSVGAIAPEPDGASGKGVSRAEPTPNKPLTGLMGRFRKKP